MQSERRRILELLSAGKITPEEAEALLEALEGGGATGSGSPARLLRVHAKDAGGGEVVINLPLALARLLLKVLPAEHRRTLEEGGVSLEELIAQAGRDLPGGKIAEVRGSNGGLVVVEVV